jgi:Putative prokaryotic signal transducing protein
MDLVAIGTAGSPIEGAMIREYLASFGIHCMVQGEHHHSMVPHAGGLIELRLLVPRYQAEEAVALLRAFPEEERSEASIADPGGEEEEYDEEEDESEADDEGGRPEDWRKDAELARRVRGARLLSLCIPGAGLAHFALGARLRGVILLCTWPAAVALYARMGPPALLLVLFSAAFDFAAAPLVLEGAQRRERARLPAARALKGHRGDDHRA